MKKMKLNLNDDYQNGITRQLLNNSIYACEAKLEQYKDRLKRYDTLIGNAGELIVFEHNKFRAIDNICELEDIEITIDANNLMRDGYHMLSNTQKACKLIALESDVIKNPDKYKKLIELHNKAYKDNVIARHNQMLEELEYDAKYASTNVCYYSVNKKNYND